MVTPEGSVEGPKTRVKRLSACNDSSLVKGMSNQRLCVAVKVIVRPNI